MGCPSKTPIIPRAQTDITDKVGRKEAKADRTTALHIFGTHTKNMFSVRIQTKNKIQKAETKPNEKQLCILDTNQKVSRLMIKLM